MLSDLKLRPYRPRLVQQLNDDDPDRRIEFCETLLTMIEEDDSIPDKIIWTDEAIFKLMGTSTGITQFTGQPKILKLLSKETSTSDQLRSPKPNSNSDSDSLEVGKKFRGGSRSY